MNDCHAFGHTYEAGRCVGCGMPEAVVEMHTVECGPEGCYCPTCDVCGRPTFGDREAGVFTELDGQPFVCGRAECNAAILAEYPEADAKRY